MVLSFKGESEALEADKGRAKEHERNVVLSSTTLGSENMNNCAN
jgi:hypothetical protein